MSTGLERVTPVVEECDVPSGIVPFSGSSSCHTEIQQIDRDSHGTVSTDKHRRATEITMPHKPTKDHDQVVLGGYRTR